MFSKAGIAAAADKQTRKRAMSKTFWAALALSALVVFVFSMASFVVVRQEATRALEQWAQKSYEPIERQWLQVHEIHANDSRSIDPFLMDSAVAVGYLSGLDSGKRAADYEVHHLSSFPYDAFFMGLGPRDGGYAIAYVDTRFIKHLCVVIGLILAVGTFVAAMLVGFYHSRYRLMRDRESAAMEAVFANASHELKNPLVAVCGYAEAIGAGSISRDEGVEKILVTTERMNETVEDILKISRLDAGCTKPVLETQDIREIIYDAARLIEDDCEARGVRLAMNLPCPLIRSCDQEMLFTAFSNVLGNARRHAKSVISVSQEEASGGGLTILFDNDGTPPSKDDLPHVFERFYRGESGECGIGLALSREYLERLGGSIEMIPLDGGARIRIVL